MLYQGDDIAADGVSECDDCKGAERVEHTTAQEEIEHVGNAMLKARKDKDHNSHKDRDAAQKILFTYLLFVCIHGNEHQNSAENAENQKTVPAVRKLHLHQILAFCHHQFSAAGQSGKPVILKRGFSATLQELVHAADFVMSCGNDQVMLCERGIRSYETQTRFTLDLCGVAWLKKHCNLPVILDPSHAMGYAYGVADLARACTAMGVDGLLVETHPKPEQAKSDAAQQLSHEQFEEMYKSLEPIAKAVGKTLI